MIDVPRDVAALLNNLVVTFPDIWLFGSQAQRNHQ